MLVCRCVSHVASPLVHILRCVCGSVLQSVAMFDSLLQRVAVCCVKCRISSNSHPVCKRNCTSEREIIQTVRQRGKQTECNFRFILFMFLSWVGYFSNERGLSVESTLQRISSFLLVVETKRFVGSTVHVILMWQTCGQRSSMSVRGKRRALAFYFSVRIWYMF